MLNPYIFILWGNQFEECPTAIFTTELRRSGLRVKVVGMDGRRMVGVHGLALIPDLTFTEALHLVNKASCIVLPCAFNLFKKQTNNLCFQKFFDDAYANHVQFVIGQSLVDTATKQPVPPLPRDSAIYPADNEDVVRFARTLANSLTGR